MNTTIRRGTLVSFDPSTWKALVMLDGSLSEVEMAVGEWVPAALLAADAEVAVLLFADTNQEDAVVLGPFGSTGPQAVDSAASPAFVALALTSYLEQAEIAAPATPASGQLRWYPDSAQSWGYFKNDAGTAVPVALARLPISPVGQMYSTAAVGAVATNWVGLEFPDAAITNALLGFALPAGWAGRAVTIRLWWAPSTTNTGNVRWDIRLKVVEAGIPLTSGSSSSTTVLSAGSGTVDQPVLASVTLSFSGFAEGQAAQLRVIRTGGHADDAFSGIARLMAAELSVVG